MRFLNIQPSIGVLLQNRDILLGHLDHGHNRVSSFLPSRVLCSSAHSRREAHSYPGPLPAALAPDLPPSLRRGEPFTQSHGPLHRLREWEMGAPDATGLPGVAGRGRAA